MASTTVMGRKLFICMLCIILALDLLDCSDAARNKNRPRKGNKQRNRQGKGQSKRQQNSEILGEGVATDSVDCPDLSKKVLRLKYETMLESNTTMSPGFAMLPAPARPVRHGITFMPSTFAPTPGTCPYTPLLNFDGNRWPRSIMEANCKCDHCSLKMRHNGDDTCPDSTNSEPPVGYCRPIRREIAVLRRAGCEGDFARYTQDVVEVTVGCECVIGTKS